MSLKGRRGGKATEATLELRRIAGTESFPPNAFTVDVEDYFQVSAFEEQFPKSSWDEIPLRIDKGLGTLLEITAQAGVTGTFYILGWLAQRRPDLIRAISEAGHEVGCHSLQHQLVYSMTAEQFRDDLRRSVDALEDATGRKCTLYRAPSFSITRDSLWALDVLAQEGILIDSSIYPVRHDRYGLVGAPRGPYRPLPDHPEFVELPPSTVKLFGMVLPCAGGGYLRLLPSFLTKAALRRINRIEKRPAVIYVHPWELDPEQPKVRASAIRNWRHRVNLAHTGSRIRALMREFEFTSVSNVVEALGGPSALPLRSPTDS